MKEELGIKVKRALISVSDKEGIEEFAAGLKKLKIELIATSGTAKLLTKKGIECKLMDELTGFTELLDGRVKTLSPKIHAAILADKRNKDHLEQLEEEGIKPIDLLIVNLYPFKKTILEKGCTEEQVIENIDIGGPTMLRGAAKNYLSCAPLVDKRDYSSVLAELKKMDNELSYETRKQLMEKAFSVTAQYDSLIHNYFSSTAFPEKLSLSLEKISKCRYGENPHQKASLYAETITPRDSLVRSELLAGKEMSFNNYFDADAAVRLVQEFEKPSAVILKHTNPCGVASAETLAEAFEKALACDDKSAFGGIIALNKECDIETAKRISAFFNEVVIAPSFDERALEELKKNKGRRVFALKNLNRPSKKQLDFKRIKGAMLVQSVDEFVENKDRCTIASEKQPSTQQWEDLLFAWKVCKHVKSNAIVLAKDLATVGIGAGQMSRVDAVELAIKKADGKQEYSVLASDGFFPFADSIHLAAKHEIKAVIEPGGSVKDDEVIEAANKHNIALVFTGVRHFKH